MADMTSTDMILSAIVGLKDDISSMKLELSAVVGLKDDISSMEQEIRTLTRKVDQTRILSGSLVEANIRNYFTKEYGESFSRHYVATDLSGLIYLATPRELRKKSDGYNVLLKQRANFINGVFRSSASVNLFEYLCGIDSSPDYHYSVVRAMFKAIEHHENIDEIARDRGQRYLTLRWALKNMN